MNYKCMVPFRYIQNEAFVNDPIECIYTDKELYISSIVVTHFLKNHTNYSQASTLALKGFIRILRELAFVSNLLYTYLKTGKETFEISPYYLLSLTETRTYENWRKTMKIHKSAYVLEKNKLASECFEITRRGDFNLDGKKEWTCISITPQGKKVAESIKYSSFFHIILPQNLLEKNFREHEVHMPSSGVLYRLIKKDDISQYIYETRNRREALKEAEKNPDYDFWRVFRFEENIYNLTKETLNYQEFDNSSNDIKEIFGLYKEKRKKKETLEEVARTTINVNLEEVISAIYNMKDENEDYNNVIFNELIRILKDSKNGKYDVTYYSSSSGGRLYGLNSNIQSLPSSLRSRIFGDYKALDMNCSNFSLLREIVKMEREKKKNDNEFVKKFSEFFLNDMDLLPVIEEMVKNKKKFRNEFVTEKMDYETVKTIITAIGYGANANIPVLSRRYGEANFMRSSDVDSSLFHISGINKMELMRTLSENKMQGLVQDVRKAGKFIIEARKRKDSEGRNYLENYRGQKLYYDRKTSFGKKVSFIVQSLESRILLKIYETHKDSIGLLLHDGVYIQGDHEPEDFSSLVSSLDIEGFKGLKITYNKE